MLLLIEHPNSTIDLLKGVGNLTAIDIIAKIPSIDNFLLCVKNKKGEEKRISFSYDYPKSLV
ncbi:hypothetical protein wTpre_460 [Wolbachia endosymbiont of Trichogramma pretiosum]|nr:hypothetical protein wTpre_460 [Wolbachia endosymbiont of Trichogramma pretiosum]